MGVELKKDQSVFETSYRSAPSTEKGALDGNQRVARFIRDLRWEALPDIVQRKVKWCLLDALGATLSGTLTPVSKIATKYATQAYRGDEATLLLRNQRATTAGAAFANGNAANGFDGDDAANFTKGHPGAQLFPATLAVAEKLGKSGQELLTAMVVGYEVAIRTGRSWHDHHEIYQSCGSWGSVATAAAASHLMGLDEQQIQHALGIAEYHAPNLPMLRDMDDPAMVKCGIGWGAFTGITSAELAASGFTGIPSILGFPEYQEWVSDIGENYLMVDNVWFKEFTCCGFAHAALLAIRELRQEHPLPADEIEHVLIEGDHFMVQLGNQLPNNTEEAQFRTAWAVAAFLRDGEVGPQQMRDERLSDKRLIALNQKIEVVENKQLSEWAEMRLTGIPGGKYANRVVITLKDGQRFDSGLVEAYSGDYGLYWKESWFEDKFRWLLRGILPEPRVEELIELVWAFEQVSDVRELTALVQ